MIVIHIHCVRDTKGGEAGAKHGSEAHPGVARPRTK